MLNEVESKLISDFQFKEDLSILNYIESSNNPNFLFECAKSYNWDDGFEVANAIADNKKCDKGIALALFWLSEAIQVLTEDIDKNDYNKEWFRFCQKIIARLSSGYYHTGPIAFDPCLGRVQSYKLAKAGVSSIFIDRVVGKQN